MFILAIPVICSHRGLRFQVFCFCSFDYIYDGCCICLNSLVALFPSKGLYTPSRSGFCLECERGTYAAGALNSSTNELRVDGKGSDQCTACPSGIKPIS